MQFSKHKEVLNFNKFWRGGQGEWENSDESRKIIFSVFPHCSTKYPRPTKIFSHGVLLWLRDVRRMKKNPLHYQLKLIILLTWRADDFCADQFCSLVARCKAKQIFVIYIGTLKVFDQLCWNFGVHLCIRYV